MNHRQRDLIYHALKHPDALYTIQHHRRTYNVSYGTARSDLLYLTEVGYLSLERQGNKMFFQPHGELLRKLKKASIAITGQLPNIGRPQSPLAITRVRLNASETPPRLLFDEGEG